jgi:HK97 family phage portal protein
MLERFLRPRTETRAMSYQALWGSGADLTTRTWSGATVTYDSALALSTTYACVRLLTDTISTLPVDTFFRSDGQRLPFRPKPAWVDEPDAGTTREEHVQQVVMSLLLDGNSYTRVYRNAVGDVVSLVVLDPTRMQIRRDRFGDVEYVWDSSRILTRADIKHITMLKRPGSLKGIGPLDEVKQSFGSAQALDEFAARFFSGGSTTSGIIETAAVLTREQALDVKSAYEETHRGLRNSHRVAVLGGGSKFTKTGVDPEQAQMLESRRFAVEEIARIFRVPLHMLQVAAPGVQSYASNEQNAIQFAQYTLRPIVSKIETAYTQLLPGGAFLRINMDGLLRGDLSSRYSAYSTGIQSGFLSISDIRRLEDLRPVEGGDVLRVPLANVNLGAADLVEMDTKVSMVQKLVVAGYDPMEALAALGLPPIRHTGLPSSQLQQIAQIDPNDPAAAYAVKE